MAGAESIILVPGLFGFARIGNIEYFAAVEQLLSKACGIDDITSLETPPTGALWRRVDVLHRAVREKIAGGAKKIHLVGHSTGGVDIRLLTNSRYLWPAGPWGDDRVSFFDHIGAIASISAPHQGTPIARRLRGTLEDAMPFLFFISILAKSEAHERTTIGKIWRGLKKVRLYQHLIKSIESGTVDHSSMKDLAKGTDVTGEALDAFLLQIMNDHPLIHELTPLAMQNVNDKLRLTTPSEGRALPVSNFVTVAPPPEFRLKDFRLPHVLQPAERVLYDVSYRATRLSPGEFGALPDGPWIGKPTNIAKFALTAQDGVVPAASQTLDGRAEALIYGDHLDVVGHYVGAKHGGETVFDSGADFDDTRMEQVWNAVAATIAQSPARFAKEE